MDITGPMIAQEVIHLRERIRHVLVAYPVNNIQALARVGVKKPQAIVSRLNRWNRWGSC